MLNDLLFSKFFFSFDLSELPMPSSHRSVYCSLLLLKVFESNIELKRFNVGSCHLKTSSLGHSLDVKQRMSQRAGLILAAQAELKA